MQKVAVYGVGKLGLDLLLGLAKRGVELYEFSYNAPGEEETYLEFPSNQNVTIKNSGKLKDSDYRNDLKYEVSHMIVTLTGAVLEREIDFLLELEIPLIILSTKYDEALIVKKANEADVKILMSQNMAFGIVDFWNRIEKMDKLDESLQIDATVLESHQNPKADISGSAMTALKLFNNKGFNVTFPEKDSFEIGKDGKSGSFSWLRDPNTQLMEGIPEKFLSGHGYHIIELKFDIYDFNFIRTLCKYFFSLEKYSIKEVLDFKVYYEEKSLYIMHNINGRDIYTDGVVKSIDFLNTKTEGVYSAIDVINANATE